MKKYLPMIAIVFAVGAVWAMNNIKNSQHTRGLEVASLFKSGKTIYCLENNGGVLVSLPEWDYLEKKEVYINKENQKVINITSCYQWEEKDK